MGAHEFFSASSQAGNLHLNMKIERLDQSIAAELRDEFVNEVSGHKGNVTVDMSSVSFIDSSGLGSLVRLKKTMAQDARVKLQNPNDFVVKILRLTDLDKVFDL